MLVLGVESSCDETGVALYDSEQGLLSHALYSQIAMHAEYGGVVPELASRDHVRRVVGLFRRALEGAGREMAEIDAIAYTQGPGLAGALLVGCAFAEGLAVALDKPVVQVHHLEGHLLSPLLSENPPEFPFVALLVSGGHTQLMRVDGVGKYELLGESLDDAAGEAFDKTAKLLGLPYPGGAALSKMAEEGKELKYKLPRPMLNSGDMDFSFSGLKTAVLVQVGALGERLHEKEVMRDMAYAIQSSIVDVLVKKSLMALKATKLKTLVVAGGVGANKGLRKALKERVNEIGARVCFPEMEFCTDNGAMIALAGCLKLSCAEEKKVAGDFRVRARWPLIEKK